MKKGKGLALLLAAASIATCGFTACNKTEVVSAETIVVKCVEAGFGTDWLYELKSKFEEAYAEEGYKVKIMTPSRAMSGETVIRDLYLGHAKSQTDLYITADIKIDKVGVNSDYQKALAADIREYVYNKPAISYSGEEESVLISDKLSADIVPFVTDSEGVMYGFNWVQSSGGLVVNTRKLAKYNLEIPKTTNEMFDCFDKIYCGYNGVANSVKSGTYPMTYVTGTNGQGYTVCFLNTLMAQYDPNFYEQFWSLQTTGENGEVVAMTDNGYEVFNNETVYEMLKVAYRTFDKNIAAPGSISQELNQAQTKMMTDKNGAVFMFNGDWMLNENKLTYEEELPDIDFVNYPVISALGIKLFGAGTVYNKSEAECDELLSYIIGLVDENKNIEDIIADVQENKGVELAEADAKEVARARGVSYSRGVEHIGFMTADTPKKEIASLFLRMMASDDFGKSFSVLGNGSTPYYAQINTTSGYKFVENASKIVANQYFSLISAASQGYRKQVLKTNSIFMSQTHIPTYISSNSTASIYNRAGEKNGNGVEVYDTVAKSLQTSEYTFVKNNWSQYKKQAGLE